MTMNVLVDSALVVGGMALQKVKVMRGLGAAAECADLGAEYG